MEHNNSGWNVAKKGGRRGEKTYSWRDLITKFKMPVDGPLEVRHPLSTPWMLWFHNSKSRDWSLAGYEKLITISTIEEYWYLTNIAGDDAVTMMTGAYSLMREGYPPIWDLPENIDGSSYALRVNSDQIYNFWEIITMACIGETICENSDSVVGISSTPKGPTCTVRVWFKHCNVTPEMFDSIKKLSSDKGFPIDFATARFVPNKEAQC